MSHNFAFFEKHYSCIVDLYSRSGKLDDAWKFISSLREGTDIDVLGYLLGACRVHNRTDVAELVSKRIFEQNPSDPGYHILLSNIYADAEMWSDMARIRTMREDGV